MTITLYGIPNCDTVKKARNWLDAHQVQYVFHDFKKAGVTKELIQGWLTGLSWEVLLNRKGTTWRKLDDATRAGVVDAVSAMALMLENPSCIKRPVLDLGLHAAPRFHAGFNDAMYQSLFSTPSRS